MYFLSIASFGEAQEHFTPTEFAMEDVAFYYKHFIPTGFCALIFKRWNEMSVRQE